MSGGKQQGALVEVLVPSGSMSERLSKRTLRNTLAKVVPDALRRERAIILRLGATAGPIYAKLRLLDHFGTYSQTEASMNPNARSFLFVCFGNIMRSPMAEALFRKAINEEDLPMQISSAGLHAIAGTPPDPRAVMVAREMNVPLDGHRAQLLTPALMAGADVVFAMDYQNKAELLARYPDHSRKIFMLSAFGEGPDRHREIPDPYMGNLDATRRCYTLIYCCIRNLTCALKQAWERNWKNKSARV